MLSGLSFLQMQLDQKVNNNISWIGSLGLKDSQNIGRSLTCIVSMWLGSMLLQLSSSMVTIKQSSAKDMTHQYPGPRGFLLILSFFIWKFATRSADRSTEPEEKESLWSRLLRISLSCWLSTWQLSKMSFTFDQSQRRMDLQFVDRAGWVSSPVLRKKLLRRESRGAFAVFTSCQTSWVLFSFLKGTNFFFGT